MIVFAKNKNFRQLLINQWISGFGDIVFYLALLRLVIIPSSLLSSVTTGRPETL